MAILLALDTSGDHCSVALCNGTHIDERSVQAPREHAERLLPMVEELLQDHQISLQACDAIAFGRGPGSFTGLRIAVGVAHGLSFGIDRPLIPISTLEALAFTVKDSIALRAGDRIHVARDARMGELYYAQYEYRVDSMQLAEPGEVLIKPEHVLIEKKGDGHVYSIGDGFDSQAAEFLDHFTDQPLPMCPIAGAIAELALARFQSGNLSDHSEALPVYLRNQVASPN